jgi:hypothetical protein
MPSEIGIHNSHLPHTRIHKQTHKNHTHIKHTQSTQKAHPQHTQSTHAKHPQTTKQKAKVRFWILRIDGGGFLERSDSACTVALIEQCVTTI